MADFKRVIKKFNLRGLNLNAPVDMLGDEWMQRAENVAIQQDSSLQARTGIVQAHTTASGPVHSLSRLNNKANSGLQAYARVAGGGTKLYSDSNVHATIMVERATGFSGEQLFMSACRPSQSPEPWMYVLDALTKKLKLRVDGTTQNWGIAPPTQAAKVAEGAPTYKVISDFEATTESAVAWTNGGTAGAITTPDRLAAGTLISQILYDRNLSTNSLNTSGWCSIAPAAFTSAIQRGMFLTTGVTTVETFRVEDVFEQIASTTIGAIKYDSGSTGLATIQPTIPIVGIRRNMLLRLGATENIRVLSVTTGGDGVQSFRAYLSTTRAAADAIDGFKSIRAYVGNTHNTTTTLTTKNFQTTVAAGSGNLTHVLARDLSNTGTRAILPTDELHFSLATSDYTKVDEIRFLFDLDDGSFTKNALYWSVRGNDLLGAIAQTNSLLTAQQRIINRTAIEQYQSQYRPMNLIPNYHQRFGLDEPAGLEFVDSPSYLDFYQDTYSTSTSPSQTTTGVSQYTEVCVPVGKLLRIGSDDSKTLRDVVAIRVDMKVTASVDVLVDAAWIGGTYLLNTEQLEGAQPYLYAYAYYNDVTGEMSNFSPPIREGVRVTNNSITLYPTASGDSQVTKYIWARNGGTLNTWTWIGTQDASDTTFTDTLSDFALLGARTFDNPWNEKFAPIPFPDIPHSGVCNVAGTEVTRVSGDLFNVSWARNTTIIINGVPRTLYTSPSSTSQLSINENLGTLSNVKFYLPQPLLISQEAESMFGPYGNGFTGLYVFFTKQNYLIWTNGDDPSAITDGNMLEVTSGSETLVAGCIYDSRPYVLSNLCMYEVSSPLLSGVRFKTRPIAHTKGLLNRYCLKVTPYGIVYLTDDGIVLSSGGESVSLTADTLRPLFPHEGQAGITTNGWAAPDMSQASKFHFEFADNNLYFDYVDTGSVRRTLVYSFLRKAWQSRNTYLQPIRTHYLEEGEGLHNLLASGLDTTAALGGIHIESVAASQDNSAGFSCIFRSGADDQGDPEAQKVYGDARIDFLGAHASTSINFTGYFNNFASGAATLNATNVTRSVSVMDINNGVPLSAKNFGLEIAWTTTDNGGATFYGWGVSYIPKPELSKLRNTDWDDAGRPNAKMFRGFILHADTFNVARSLKVEFDDGTLSAAISITHNGERSIEYALATPVIAHKARLQIQSDANSWQFYDVRWIADDQAENTKLWTDWMDGGYAGAKRLKGVIIDADTSNAESIIDIRVDGSTSTSTSLSIIHNGRKREAYELTPAIAHIMRVVPTNSINLRLYGVEWMFDQQPELGGFNPDFSNLDYIGAKRISGVIIETDTSGGAVNFVVQKDGSASTVQTLSINHNGRYEETFELTPFIASEVKIIPASDVRVWGVRWIYEQYPELAAITPDFTDVSEPGDKRVYGITIEADTTDSAGGDATVTIQKDGSASTVQTLVLTHAGRRELTYELTPFVASTLRLVPSEDLRLWNVKWLYEKLPENATLLYDFNNLGYEGAKRITGLILEVDTSGVAINFDVIKETGAALANLQVNHNGRKTSTFEFSTPIAATLVKLVPAADWRFYNARFLYEQYPELAGLIPDFSDLGEAGDKRIIGVTIEADTSESSGGDAILLVQKDGSTSTVQSLTITHAGRKELTYELTPFVASEVRLVPSEDLRYFGAKWIYEKYPENSALLYDYSNLGYVGPKLIQGVNIEADTLNQAVAFTIERDGGTQILSSSITHNGKLISTFPIVPSVIANEVRITPAADWRYFTARWIFEPQPEKAALTPDWMDAGHIGAKFMQGCVIDMDTEGASVTFNFYRDGNIVTSMYSEVISTSGRQQVAVDFTTPFIASIVKYIAGGAFRFYGIKWISEPEPELAKVWWGQATSHDQEGWMSLKEAEIALISSATVVLAIYVDDNLTPYTYNIASTGGLFLRQQVTIASLKGKQFTYKLTSANEFRLYQKDSHVKIMPWDVQQGDYLIARPFGGPSRTVGAEI